MTRGAAVVAVLILMLVSACAPAERQSTKSVGPDLLSPYESGGWPAFLQRLTLPRERDYVVLAYVPPAHPIDLSTPARARRTLALMTFDQLGAMEAGTTIGHLVVAWQCDGVQGMTSMTGEQDSTGQKMYLSGWGVTPVFSTFADGALVDLADFPAEQHRVLLEGRGVVVAAEVDRAGCARARGAVREFAAHPEAPHLNYSLLLDPARFEGGGCLSFALHVAAEAGVMAELPGLVNRDVELRAAQLGARDTAPEGVEVYRAPGGAHPDGPVGVLELLGRDWAQGPVVDVVTIPDGEAIMAAMVYARVGTAPKNDWRYSRIMDRADPVIGPAATYGYGWARAYPNRRIADASGVEALVLER